VCSSDLEYQQVGGGGGSSEETFETVSKNLKASDYELTYNGAGDLTVITYANGIIKTLGYLGSGDLGTITLSGATPGGIDLVKTLTYNVSGDLESVAYS
jgi:YD repeat-containing protein